MGVAEQHQDVTSDSHQAPGSPKSAADTRQAAGSPKDGHQSAAGTRQPEAQIIGRVDAEESKEDEQGLEPVLQNLLASSPVQVTDWLLNQMQLMSRSNVVVEELPIYELASCIDVLTAEQKKLLVSNAVTGFSSLSPEKRTQGIRLIMQTSQLAAESAVPNDSNEHASDDADCKEHAAASSTDSVTPVESSDKATVETTPLFGNMLQLAAAAQLRETHHEEFKTLIQEARGEVLQHVQLSSLVETVSDLEEEERASIVDTLVRANVLPEEQQGLLSSAVRCGGYIDTFAPILHLAEAIRRRQRVFWAWPLLELFVAITMGAGPGPALSCSTGLAVWLRGDALLALNLALSLHCTGRALSVLCLKLRGDPSGIVQRWRAAEDEGHGFITRLQLALTGIDKSSLRTCCIGSTWCSVLALAGAVYAVDGMLELLTAFALGCNEMMLFAAFVFIGLRIGILVALVCFAKRLRDQMSAASKNLSDV